MRIDLSPASMLLGLAPSVITGANAETVMVADWVAEPPVPVQVSSYTVVLESASVDQVPTVATGPCQPPEAVQAVAFDDFQLKRVMPPLPTVAGEAVNVTSATPLLVAANVAAGFELPAALGSELVVWAEDDAC
jgi:hypothetical protein